MKAIKFLILGAGIIGIVSFFLPLLNVDQDEVSLSVSSFDVVTGIELAEELRDKVATDVATLDDTGQGSAFVAELDEALDAVKIFLLILFAPIAILFLVGAVGVARRRLGRPGGTLALIAGLIGAGFCAIVLAAWGSPEVKASGGSSGVAVYLMFLANIVGFVGGLLTLIKPDRGGRFG